MEMVNCGQFVDSQLSQSVGCTHECLAVWSWWIYMDALLSYSSCCKAEYFLEKC